MKLATGVLNLVEQQRGLVWAWTVMFMGWPGSLVTVGGVGAPTRQCYPCGMSFKARGQIQDGHLRLDIPVDLPDNTEVDVLGNVLESENESETETDDERELREAIAQSDAELARGEGIPAEQVLADLRARRRR